MAMVPAASDKEVAVVIARPFPGWRLCLQWIGATILGLATGAAVVVMLRNIFAVALPGDWSAVVIGTWAGLAQWVALCGHLSRAGWWILASIAGWVLGLPIGARVASWAHSEIMTAGLAMASIGLMQWLVLRGQVLRAGWWVLASTTGGSSELWWARVWATQWRAPSGLLWPWLSEGQ